MSYLARLRALEPEETATPATDKTDTGPSVSFVSAPSTPFLGGEVSGDRLDEIRSRSSPDGFSVDRWLRLHGGALRFAEQFGATALRLGWSTDELFAFAEPFANVGLQGAAWFVSDSEVIEVTAAAITLRTANGATQRFYRRSLQ